MGLGASGRGGPRAHVVLCTLTALGLLWPPPPRARAQATAAPPAELAVGPHDAYVVTPAGRVLHRTDARDAWEALPAPPRCGPDGVAANRAAVTDTGALVLAVGACVVRWQDGRWHATRLGPPGLATLTAVATAGGTTVAIATLDDGSGDAVYSFHLDADGSRAVTMPRRPYADGGWDVFFGALAPDDLVLLGVRETGIALRERSYRYDGTRWRAAADLPSPPTGGASIPGVGFAALMEEGVAVGRPGAWTTADDTDLEYVDLFAGTLEDRWTYARSRGRLVHRVGDEVVTSLDAPELGDVAPLAGTLVAVSVDGATAFSLSGSTLAATALASAAPAAVEDVTALATGLDVLPPPPPPPPLIAGSSPEAVRASLAGVLDSPGVVVRSGATRFALVPVRADTPELTCEREHVWHLVRIEAGAATTSVPVSDARCPDTAPLALPDLSVRDLDGDGRDEVLARVPLELTAGAGLYADHVRIVSLVVADAATLRIEGATVVAAERTTDAWAWLVATPTLAADGASLTRTVTSASVGGGRLRAPRLLPCPRDATADTFSCPGDSLEHGLVGRIDDVRLPVLPAATAR